MKLLVYVNSWAPSVGGVETITKILAEGLVEWSKEHHEATDRSHTDHENTCG